MRKYTLKRSLAAALICTALMPRAALAEELRLSPPEARQVAQHALQSGNPQLAASLAQGLLQRDGADGTAHFMLARAFQQMGQPAKGRRAARLAYRHAVTEVDHFHAAQLAARLAVENQRPMSAKLWLRRSLQYLPDPKLRAAVARDYQILRNISPWQFGLNVSVAPSDNLNNGADSRYSLIDGVPVAGILSGSAQALSGVAGVADLTLGYRLMGSKTSQTRIGLRYYGRRVHLSDEARDLAPTVSNSDLAFDYGEVSLARLHQTAAAQWRYGFALGQSWSGGERFQRSTRLNVSRGATLGALGRLRLGSQLERLSYSDNRPDVNGISLSSHLSRHSEDWGNWQLGLTLKRERSDNINADRKQVIAQISWAPDVSALPVMSDLTPVVTLGGSKQRYDAYSAGFIVPGGRRDETVFGQLEATFTQFDYAGFAPTVTLRSRRTTSNVSRFETRETTLSLGVRSSF